MKIVKSGVPANLTKRVPGKTTGNFGGAKSRLSSGVAQKQMCAKDRTRPEAQSKTRPLRGMRNDRENNPPGKSPLTTEGQLIQSRSSFG